jgi:hypothetical protein
MYCAPVLFVRTFTNFSGREREPEITHPNITRSLRWALTVALACLALVAAPAHADQSRLDIDVEMTRDFGVSVRGLLTDERGNPIRQQPVVAHLGEHPVASANTRGNGVFELRFDVPEHLRIGNRVLTVAFSGAGEHSPAQSSVTLALGGQPQPPAGAGKAPAPAPTPATPPAPAAPPSEQPAAGGPAAAPPSPTHVSKLSATADNPSPSGGSVVELAGQLLGAAGHPLAGAGIVVLDPRGESGDSFTVTGPDGTFLTFYEVPLEQSGPMELTVRFAGIGDYLPAQASVELNVRLRPTPAPSVTPSASPSPSPSASPSVDEAQPVAARVESAPPTPVKTDPGPELAAWVIGAVVVVGGSTAIIGSVVGLGALRRRHLTGADGADFPLFDDADDASSAPAPAEPRHGAY